MKFSSLLLIVLLIFVSCKAKYQFADRENWIGNKAKSTAQDPENKTSGEPENKSQQAQTQIKICLAGDVRDGKCVSEINNNMTMYHNRCSKESAVLVVADIKDAPKDAKLEWYVDGTQMSKAQITSFSACDEANKYCFCSPDNLEKIYKLQAKIGEVKSNELSLAVKKTIEASKSINENVRIKAEFIYDYACMQNQSADEDIQPYIDIFKYEPTALTLHADIQQIQTENLTNLSPIYITGGQTASKVGSQGITFTCDPIEYLVPGTVTATKTTCVVVEDMLCSPEPDNDLDVAITETQLTWTDENSHPWVTVIYKFEQLTLFGANNDVRIIATANDNTPRIFKLDIKDKFQDRRQYDITVEGEQFVRTQDNKYSAKIFYVKGRELFYDYRTSFPGTVAITYSAYKEE